MFAKNESDDSKSQAVLNMKPNEFESLSADRHSEVLRELQVIRNLVCFLVILVIAMMCYAIDRELPLILIQVGLLLFIGGAILVAILKRARRVSREAESFRSLSGRDESPTK